MAKLPGVPTPPLRALRGDDEVLLQKLELQGAFNSRHEKQVSTRKRFMYHSLFHGFIHYLVK